MRLLEARDVRKSYGTGDALVEAVRGVDLSIEAGELVALMGPSGCGKSTLLHLCGAMDRATSGRLEVLGVVLGGLDDVRLTLLRRDMLGFVFQLFHLLPTMTVEENVALPLLLAGRSRAGAMAKARGVATEVGLGHRLAAYPQHLSGGEMQRTAIARAVVHEPRLVIADEPTGNLDSESGAQILTLLAALTRRRRMAVLIATHDRSVAATATRTLHMRDGRLIDDARPLAADFQQARATV